MAPLSWFAEVVGSPEGVFDAFVLIPYVYSNFRGSRVSDWGCFTRGGYWAGVGGFLSEPHH